jgi:hypothetical protein
MIIRKDALMLLFIFSLCFFALPQNQNVPVVIIPHTHQSPVLDGNDDDNCWKEALEIGPLLALTLPYSGESLEPARPASSVRIIHNSKALYVFCRFQEPHIDKMQISPHQPGRPGAELWLEEHVELFFQIVGSESQFQFMANPLGAKAQVKQGKDSALLWDVAASIDPDEWTLEISIPSASLNADFSTATAMRFNIFRVRRTEGVEYSCWVPVRRRFAEFENSGYLVSGSLEDTLSAITQKSIEKKTIIWLEEINDILTKLKRPESPWDKQYKELKYQFGELTHPEIPLTFERWKMLTGIAGTLKEKVQKLREDLRLLEILQ